MDEDTLNCMLPSWYPKFHSVTFKSAIIPLSPSFVEYLHEDGLFMPASAFPKYPHVPYDDLAEDNWSDDDDGDDDKDEEGKAASPNFPELERDITNAITDMGGSVFPKLNWSSPKDATWMTVGGNLKCMAPHDIFLLLKSSDFINYDLQQLKSCSTQQISQPLSPCLVLRKWYDLQQSMEFRCFVYNTSLVGISQRDHTNFYSFLIGDMEKIKTVIQDFFTTKLQQFPSKNYIFDVYIVTDTWRVWLVDFSPWNSSTEALMFDWAELIPQPTWEGVCVRLVESQSTIRPTLAMTNRLPADLVDVSHSAAIEDLCRQLRGELELAGK